MKLSLTESDMLKIWRRARAIEPLRLDCTADRTDGPDVDSILVDQMRTWYLDLLDNAPLSKLVQVECVDSASVSFSDSGLAVVSAPESCRRIVSVRFSDWDFPVGVSDSPVPLSAANPFCRRPAAFRIAPSRIAVIGTSGNLSELKCILDISDKMYIFDNSALSSIYDSASY